MVNPFRKAKDAVMRKILTGLIRHALTAAGGGLVADGSLSGSDLEATIGAILTIVGVVASVLSKRAEAAALAADQSSRVAPRRSPID